jgi:hypothetical protein
MSRTLIEIHRTKAGQSRAYADTVYEGTITFTNYWDSTSGEQKGTWDPSEEIAKRMARMFLAPFDDPAAYALSPRLDKLEKLERGKWAVRVVHPFCD